LTSFTVLAVEAAILSPPPPPGDEREREAGSVDAAALGARVRRRRAQDSYMAGFGHPTVAMG